MLQELRTSELTPRSYYEVCKCLCSGPFFVKPGIMCDTLVSSSPDMVIFQEMMFLEGYFSQLAEKNQNMEKLYEMVQHAGHVVTRLYVTIIDSLLFCKNLTATTAIFSSYLLITVGASYIKSRQVHAKVILKDLIEMVRGVQEPQRGLFLRYFLSQMTKNVLPDSGSPYEGEGGSVTDALDFVLENFRQMNRLWV